MYLEQFDRIGKFPGKVKLVTDPDAPPHVDAPRKTPIALKDAIKGELEKMEADGSIRRVTEPTDWVSSLAVTPTRKVEICESVWTPDTLTRPSNALTTKSQQLKRSPTCLEAPRYFPSWMQRLDIGQCSSTTSPNSLPRSSLHSDDTAFSAFHSGSTYPKISSK